MQYVGGCVLAASAGEAGDIDNPAATFEGLVLMDDRRKRLETLRTQLEQALSTCSENMLPQLAGQYRATLADIAALPPEAQGEVKASVSDFESRRQKRIADAATPAPAKRKAHKRGS